MDEEDDYLNADASDFDIDDSDSPKESDSDADSDDQEAEAAPSKKAKPVADDGPPPPPTDHVVHLYEFGKFHRTIDRAFAAEDAQAFASEYNRTAKPYGRFAVAEKEKTKAKKTVPWPVGAPK